MRNTSQILRRLVEDVFQAWPGPCKRDTFGALEFGSTMTALPHHRTFERSYNADEDCASWKVDYFIRSTAHVSAEDMLQKVPEECQVSVLYEHLSREPSPAAYLLSRLPTRLL